MKILVTGGSGQLGQDCERVFADHHTLFQVDVGELDITDPDQVADFFEETGPDVVINCAAYTAVDNCEAEVERCMAINRDGPLNLAACCNRFDARLVHISTDYVFDGRKPRSQAYHEDDPPNPLSAYGRSKLAGEQAAATARDHCILRPAWLYGISGKNFLKTMLRLALAEPQRTIRVVNDQHGSLTWSYRLAQQIEQLLGSEYQGIYHATAEGSASWFDVASHFLGAMGVEHSIAACSTREYPTPAHRPANSILENTRLKAAGRNLMRHWRDDLELFIGQHRQELLAEAARSIAST